MEALTPRGLSCSRVRQSRAFVPRSGITGSLVTGELSCWHTN